MNKNKPTLYDHRGNEIERSFPQTGDPTFLHGNLGRSSTTAKIERRPYQYHSWVFACVHRIVINVATLPHVIFEWQDDDPKLIRDHETLKLFRRPNHLMSGSELWEYIVLNLMLPTTRTPGGQCFLIPENGKGENVPDFSKGDIPKELWPFSDEVIKPRHDPKTKMLNGWRFVVGGIETHQYELNEVIRIRLVNPYDIEKGLSPYSAAGLAVRQDVKSDEYNTRFFDNMGAVGGVLSTDQEIDPDQARRVKDEFMEEYGGSGNAGKVAVFGMGVKYEQFLKSHLDMQFSEQKKDNRTRIQAVYGVPDSEIAIFAAGMNRATAQQADRNFWQKTLIPLDQKIMDTINIRWVENVDRGQWHVKSDYSKVSALKNMYSEEIKDAERLVKMHVPTAEALRVTDVPVDTGAYDWLEESFINSNMIPISWLEEEPEESQDEPEKPDNADDDKAAKGSGMFRDTNPLVDAIDKATAEERKKISEKWIKTVLNPGERSMGTDLKKWFAGLKREMADNVNAWLKEQDTGKSVTLKQAPVDPKKFVFDPKASLVALEAIEKEHAATQAKREEANLKEEYGDEIGWNATDETIGKFVKERQVYVKKINTTVFNAARTKINSTVQMGINENWTPQELAKNLKSKISAIKTDSSEER